MSAPVAVRSARARVEALRGRAARDAGPVLHVVAPPARHPLLWTLLGVLALAAAVFGAVTATALAADAAVEARELEAGLADAEATYTELLAEVAMLEDPARIAAAAEDLGLVRVEHPRQLVVDRLLPADGAGRAALMGAGETTDHLKPLLADDRG